MDGSEDNANKLASSLGSISQGAGLFFIGKATTNAFSFVTNLILTRILGASLYGLFSYLNVVFSLVMVFTRLGGDKSVLRYLPEYDDDPHLQNVMLTIAYGTSLIASIVVATAVYLSAPIISAYTLNEPMFTDILRVAAFVLPFNTLANITYSAFKGINKMEYNVVVSSILQPFLRLVFVGGSVLLGFSLYGATVGYVVTGMLTCLGAIAMLKNKTNIGSIATPSSRKVKEYYNFSIPLTFNQLGNFLYNRVDILMVGFFLSSSIVGVYNISVMLSGLLSIPLMALNQMFPPIASKLYHNDDVDELEEVYSTVTRWIFTLSVFPVIAAILLSESILNVFGPEFTQGQLVLILFAFAQFTNCAVGPSGFLLMMTDHQYVTLANQLSSGILNAILNYVFILQFGFIGAALATASVLTLINLVRLIEVWHFEGLFPYDKKYFKPLVAGIPPAILLLLMSSQLNGNTLLVSGGLTGGILFCGSIWALGIEDADKQMIEQLLSKAGINLPL